MSLVVLVKTHSLNGLPIDELAEACKKHGLPYVESVSFSRVDRRNRKKPVIYNVCLHEEVLPLAEWDKRGGV